MAHGPRATSGEPRATNPGSRPSATVCHFGSFLSLPAAGGALAFPSSPFFMDSLPIGTEVVHNGVCTSVHVKNHQIRVKIDQKGDVFRQKGIKKARISSCPS